MPCNLQWLNEKKEEERNQIDNNDVVKAMIERSLFELLSCHFSLSLFRSVLMCW